jgi:hypothetical protein
VKGERAVETEKHREQRRYAVDREIEEKHTI